MEPNDADLHELLREWKAPEAPPSLDALVLKKTTPWWRVLLRGYVRLPVPVACFLAILMIGGAWRLATLSAAGCSAANVSSPVFKQRPLPAGSTDADKQRAAACAVGQTC